MVFIRLLIGVVSMVTGVRGVVFEFGSDGSVGEVG